ncbi:MAG TPA: hypothetical protein VFR32_10220 [Gaiellaceae bacterium]|nr:hypothetical protein [Gaiellaceae bacterium]
MTARRGSAIALTVVAIAVVLSLFGSTAGALPPGVVENCSSQSGGGFAGALTKPRNLVVGPLALIGAGGTPVYADSLGGGSDGGQKFPALVKVGHQVTVELSKQTRRDAGLAYGPLPQRWGSLRGAHRVVTFIACRRAEASRSSADGQAVTFWSGGVVARSPRCVPLRVWVDAERSPRRAVIRLGVRRCG